MRADGLFLPVSEPPPPPGPPRVSLAKHPFVALCLFPLLSLLFLFLLSPSLFPPKANSTPVFSVQKPHRRSSAQKQCCLDSSLRLSPSWALPLLKTVASPDPPPLLRLPAILAIPANASSLLATAQAPTLPVVSNLYVSLCIARATLAP